MARHEMWFELPLWILGFAAVTAAAKEYRLLADIASHQTMIPTRGYHANSTAFLFTGDQRRFKVSDALLRNVIREIVSGREFQFVVLMRQEKVGQGVLLYIYRDTKRLFDIQSNWKKREIRLNYFLGIEASHVHSERMPYELADGQWHEVALSFSGLRLTMFVDCHRIYVRTLPHILPFGAFVQADTMWLGQRGNLRKSYFQGAMETARFIVGSEETYAQSCRDSQPDACPTCSQHLNLVTLVNQLQHTVRGLQEKLHSAETSITDLRRCECLKKCRVGNRTYLDGERWAVGKCTDCVCKNGKTVCGEKKCPMLNCKFPIKVKSECCPICSVSCEFRGVVIEHGERKVHKVPDRKVCVICTCEHGGMRCRQYRNMSLICPKLTCPLSKQFTTPDDCCNFCPNTDFCAMNPNCDRNADCINLSTKHICKCRPGYRGNGYFCEDIDECKEGVKNNKQLCDWNSHCVNTNGSYICKCKDGYAKDKFNFCTDFDECASERHSCSPNAECINIDGSHKCRCRRGFLGNGYNCTAQCEGMCQNGGLCMAPNTCKCPTGFRGDRCHIDIDECALGLHKCHRNSRCVNVPGSYHCECLPGFTDNGRSNQFGDRCQDLNECDSQFSNLHTCNPEMECRNLVGSYECVCRNKQSCSRDCVYQITRRSKNRIRHGVRFYDPLQTCHACKCKNGVISCKPLSCNCKNKLSQSCCPSCQNRRCFFRGRSYASGQTWTFDCSQCRCENGVRRCRQFLCPSMASCTTVITPPGHCCPVCASETPCNLPIDVNPYRFGNPGYCDHKGRRFQHGQEWSLADSLCISCQCKFGHICCTHMQQCRAAISTVT